MIHQYRNNGYNIVLDVESGAIHVVDDITYDMIASYETSSKAAIVKEIREKYPNVSEEEIDEAYEEIRALEEAGDLFTKD